MSQGSAESPPPSVPNQKLRAEAIAQHFGDEQTIDANDVANRDIDKRSFINLFIGNDSIGALSADTLEKLLNVLEHYGDGRQVQRALSRRLTC